MKQDFGMRKEVRGGFILLKEAFIVEIEQGAYTWEKLFVTGLYLWV